MLLSEFNTDSMKTMNFRQVLVCGNSSDHQHAWQKIQQLLLIIFIPASKRSQLLVYLTYMENNFAIYSCLDKTQQKARVEHRYCNNLFNWWQILNDVYQRPEIIQSQKSLCNDFRTLANIACNLSSIKLRSSEFETRYFNIWGQLALLISKRVWQKSTPWMTNNILASILRYNDAY